MTPLFAASEAMMLDACWRLTVRVVAPPVLAVTAVETDAVAVGMCASVTVTVIVAVAELVFAELVGVEPPSSPLQSLVPLSKVGNATADTFEIEVALSPETPLELKIEVAKVGLTHETLCIRRLRMNHRHIIG
jgi:hypothetical protein